ncbi:MAG: YiiX/YebB-like N1pC/P60 family cysteine hydrolase [Prosthecobacter sp.]|nr:YiiX/YebB-like N1pC/P60 family cysteine hydrolase [Prosthecobacter sp.]
MCWPSSAANEAFAVCRMKPAFSPKVGAMITAAKKFIGLPYDIQHELDDETIDCSEPINKGFKAATGQSLGTIVKLGELNWRPHEQVIRAIAGDPIPLGREMITSRDLAKAEQPEGVLRGEVEVGIFSEGLVWKFFYQRFFLPQNFGDSRQSASHTAQRL